MSKRRASRTARERKAASTAFASARVRERAAQATVAPRLTWGRAAMDAMPSFLAAVTCALAWWDPRFPGIDMLRIAAPLYFLELPLAIVFVFADSWRVPGEYLSKRSKLKHILIPTLLLSWLCWALFGAVGLLSVAWLGGGALWRLLREGEDRTVTGRWLIIRQNPGGEGERWIARKRPRQQDVGDAWIVPLAHHEFLPGATILVWIGLAFVLFTGVDIPPGGALPAYAEAVGWTATTIGSVIPAHEALAAGTALFLVRTFGFFDEVGDDAPPASIEDDETLKEIIATVDRKKPSWFNPWRPRQ